MNHLSADRPPLEVRNVLKDHSPGIYFIDFDRRVIWRRQTFYAAENKSEGTEKLVIKTAWKDFD
jgi:hypothetical protein